MTVFTSCESVTLEAFSGDVGPTPPSNTTGRRLDKASLTAAEALARHKLSNEIYTGEDIPAKPYSCRRPGAIEAFIELLTAVRAAGSWKRYAAEPRVQLVVLRKLAESGRAVATRGVLTRLFAPRRRLQSIGSPLPDVLFWKILEFWRTDRDP